jgi:SAM-dependent methyltransferase
MRDAATRLGLADPAMWAYGLVTSANPRTVLANSRLRKQGAPDHLPIPPWNLIFLVAGTTDVSWFLKAGSLAAASISEILSAHGTAVEDIGSMLDFGCGCGRVLRHWHGLRGTRICGTDSNESLVEWARANLPFAEVSSNRLEPPLGYAGGEFDLVYALSVFTHLTPELQAPWMDELFRVLKPGGHLVVSTHGEHYIDRLNPAERRRFERGQLIVKDNTKAPGSNMCSAYHPLAYMRDSLAKRFETVAFIPEGAQGNPSQDLYLLRKPADEPA